MEDTKACPFCGGAKNDPAFFAPELYPEEVMEGWVALDGYCANEFHYDEE